MKVIPFIPAHLKDIKPHRHMQFIEAYLDSEEYANLLMSGDACTATVDGRVIACAGLISVGTSRLVAWALMTDETAKYMLPITREVNKAIDGRKEKRIETPVKHDFEQGHRWMRLLGFENETPNGMRCWGDDGETYDLYARCKC